MCTSYFILKCAIIFSEKEITSIVSLYYLINLAHSMSQFYIFTLLQQSPRDLVKVGNSCKSGKLSSGVAGLCVRRRLEGATLIGQRLLPRDYRLYHLLSCI